MASSVATSPFPDAMVDEKGASKGKTDCVDWTAIANFDATFGGNNGIDPLMFTNAASPACGVGNTFHANAINESPSTYGTYPSSTNVSNTPGQYYPSVELGSAGPSLFTSSDLHYQPRQRSVSEPPGGSMQQHRHAQSGPHITFHRGGHYLGAPQGKQQPKSLKSLPKEKQIMRAHPYIGKNGRPTPHEQQATPTLRRAQTPLTRLLPPTSMPMPTVAPPQQHPMAHSMEQPAPHLGVHETLPILQDQRYVSTRVCTPTPNPPPMAVSPQQAIDPSLKQSPLQSSSNVRGYVTGAVTVPLTVQELRAMITEAVQTAFNGWEEETAGAGTGITQDAMQAEDHNAGVDQTLEETLDSDLMELFGDMSGQQ